MLEPGRPLGFVLEFADGRTLYSLNLDEQELTHMLWDRLLTEAFLLAAGLHREHRSPWRPWHAGQEVLGVLGGGALPRRPR